MIIDEKTNYILRDKLHFSPAHISRLEKNTALLSKTLGLIELIKRTSDKKEIRIFVQNQLQNIRRSLVKSGSARCNLLQKARAEYYTFQRVFP